MPTDPRYVVRSLFDPGESTYSVITSNLTLDDGSTPAKHEACFADSENRLTTLFHEHHLDVLFVVDRAGKTPLPSSGPPIAYVHHLYIQPACIDKRNSSGTMVLTASMLLDKALQEADRVIRNNMAGSMKLVGSTQERRERVGSTLIYGDVVSVDYTQYVTVYETPTGQVTDRRFGNYVNEWRVGVSGSDYSAVGPASGVTARWRRGDTWVILGIPRGDSGVYQDILNPDVEGTLYTFDYEAVTALLYETDISATGGDQYAVVKATGRKNAIAYFVLVVPNTKVANTSDDRTQEESSFSFTNVRIGEVREGVVGIATPWEIDFYAEHVTQTDA